MSSFWICHLNIPQHIWKHDCSLYSHTIDPASLKHTSQKVQTQKCWQTLILAGIFGHVWAFHAAMVTIQCNHQHPIISSKYLSHPFCTFMRNCVPKIVKINRIGISEWGLKSYIDLSSYLFEDYTVLHVCVYLHLPSSPPRFIQLTIHIYPLKTSPYLHLHLYFVPLSPALTLSLWLDALCFLTTFSLPCSFCLPTTGACA